MEEHLPHRHRLVVVQVGLHLAGEELPQLGLRLELRRQLLRRDLRSDLWILAFHLSCNAVLFYYDY